MSDAINCQSVSEIPVASAQVESLQRGFREVMQALARPGILRQIPLDCAKVFEGKLGELSAPMATLISMLVDQGTTFCVAGLDPTPLTRAICAETHSSPAVMELANFIVVPLGLSESDITEAITQASGGTLLSPEFGATILLEVESLEAGSKITLVGPGIQTENNFLVSNTQWARARYSRNDEFPCGVDILLVDSKGNLAGIPRTSDLTITEQGSDD